MVPDPDQQGPRSTRVARAGQRDDDAPGDDRAPQRRTTSRLFGVAERQQLHPATQRVDRHDEEDADEQRRQSRADGDSAGGKREQA